MKERVTTTAMLIAVFLCGVHALAQSTAEELRLKLDVSSVRRTYLVGQDVVLRITLSNVGTRPVYVPSDLNTFGNVVHPFRMGALNVQIYNADGAQLVPVIFADPAPEAPAIPEALAELLGLPAVDSGVRKPEDKKVLSVRKKWNLLRPGYSFSTQMSVQKDMTAGLQPLEQGDYTICVALNTADFSEAQVQALKASLDYPFFNGYLESKPIHITYRSLPKKHSRTAGKQQ